MQLSDLANLTLPFNFGPANASHGYLSTGLVGAPKENIPIERDEVEKEYARIVGVPYPIPSMPFVRSWMSFRVGFLLVSGTIGRILMVAERTILLKLAIIAQGIAARVARGQASSANAAGQAEMFPILGRIARDIYMVESPKKALL